MMTTKATMTSQRKMIWMTPSNRTLHPEIMPENLDLILSHFQEPIFPRNIMTKALGYQKEVFSIQEVLEYFRAQTMKTAGSTLIHHLLNITALTELHQVF